MILQGRTLFVALLRTLQGSTLFNSLLHIEPVSAVADTSSSYDAWSGSPNTLRFSAGIDERFVFTRPKALQELVQERIQGWVPVSTPPHPLRVHC